MIELDTVAKTFPTKRGPVTGIDGVSLQIKPGEFVCIVGPSGCGKTTLLMALGGMARPTGGQVLVEGKDLYALDAGGLANYRARFVGFVFQLFHLVPYLSVRENVLLGSRGDGEPIGPLLERLNLTERAHHKPGQLSAGEQQRAAIARAMARQPKLILGDEPTGNLDRENAAEVYKALDGYRRDGGTVVVVTHGTIAAEYADRVITMRDGKIAD